MTVQAVEIIIYKGQRLSMYQQPLSLWLNKNSLIKFDTYSTAHWRGYEGTWEIRDNKLFLIDIKSSNYTINQLFDNVEIVFADWFSGDITIGSGSEKFDEFATYHDNLLSLTIVKGVITEKQIVFNINEEQIFSFGKYKNIPVLDVINGRWTWKHSYVLRNYLNDLLQFLTTPNFNQKVIVPHFDLEKFEKSPGTPFDISGIKFFITPNYIAVNRQTFYINEDKDEYSETFSKNLELLLLSDFTKLFPLYKKANPDDEISPNTLLFNPNVSYIIWAIKNINTFSIPPKELDKTFKLKFLKTFTTKRLNPTVFEYNPVFIEEAYTFPDSIQLINANKFTLTTGLLYQRERNRYISSKSQEEILKEYCFYLNDTITSLDIITNNKVSNLRNYTTNYEDPYISSYEKYGGYNGYDDNTIDDAFEGDPSNTWNID